MTSPPCAGAWRRFWESWEPSGARPPPRAIERPAAGDAGGAAATEFLKEFEGIVAGEPIRQDELDFAKDSIVMGYGREFETIGQLGGAVTGQVVYGLPDDNFARYPERVAAVDLDTVRKAAASYFDPENLAIIIVGDLEKIEEPVRALNLGPVRLADADGKVSEERELSSR